ncbi:MAG: GDP-mannose 6-dehydrogenase, partial [uncultured Gemmatimonadaceae bacterium]
VHRFERVRAGLRRLRVGGVLRQAGVRRHRRRRERRQGRPRQRRQGHDRRERHRRARRRDGRRRPAPRDDELRRGGRGVVGVAHLRRHAEPPQRRHRPLVHREGVHRDRPRAARQGGAPHRRRALDRAPRHHGHGRDPRARGRVGQEGRPRLRRLHEPRVPARGDVDQGLLRPAVHGDRHARRGRRRDRRRALHGDRRAGARRRDRRRRDDEVRLQLLPRPQGRLRQRDRRGVQGARRRQPRGDAALLRGHEAQRLGRLPAPGLRVRRVVPAQGPPRDHLPRQAGRRRHADPLGDAREQPQADRPRLRHGDGRRQPPRRAARAQLQGRHRRPARVAARHPHRDAHREGDGHRDLRRPRVERAAHRGEPRVHRARGPAHLVADAPHRGRRARGERRGGDRQRVARVPPHRRPAPRRARRRRPRARVRQARGQRRVVSGHRVV